MYSRLSTTHCCLLVYEIHQVTLKSQCNLYQPAKRTGPKGVCCLTRFHSNKCSRQKTPVLLYLCFSFLYRDSIYRYGQLNFRSFLSFSLPQGFIELESNNSFQNEIYISEQYCSNTVTLYYYTDQKHLP